MEWIKDLVILYRQYQQEVVIRFPNYNDADFSFELFMDWLEQHYITTSSTPNL